MKGDIKDNFSRRYLVLAVIILVPLLAACSGSTSVSASDVRAVSDGIICKCGCSKVLSTCDCTDAEEMTALIEKNLAQGQSGEQVLQLLVDRYGRQVLPAPTVPQPDVNK